MYRLYNIFWIIILAAIMIGCNFVNIDTPGIINDKRMFSDEQGFKDALTGIYANMAKPELYGCRLSFGFIDEIAQLYYNDTEITLTPLTKTYNLKYKDVDVQKNINSIWSNAYFTIYAINNVLHQLKLKPNLHNAKLYKAECLTLRAMLHFDLLRLFAPNYDQHSVQGIPYVMEASVDPTPISSVDNCNKKIINDLQQADKLFSTIPISNKRSTNMLYANRNAAKALLARVYNWDGNSNKAIFYAKQVLDANFKLSKDEELLQLFRGYTAKQECIFAINAPKAHINVKTKFFPARLTPTCNIVRNNYKQIFNVSTFTADNNDYRYQAYFALTDWGRPVTAFVKFYDKYYEENQTWLPDRIPAINIIRLPEMYYIIAESEYINNNQKQCLKALNTVITSRGLKPIKIEDIQTDIKFKEILSKEIIKEYWGEGQAFFTYKRFKLPMKGLNGKIFEPNNRTYVLPLPDSEVKTPII